MAQPGGGPGIAQTPPSGQRGPARADPVACGFWGGSWERLGGRLWERLGGRLRNRAVRRRVVLAMPGSWPGLTGDEQMRGLLLWLIGVPLPVILLIYLIF